jgi:hypothetical protein
MALQQINWTQIDTSNVPSGSIIDLGAVSGALHAVYAENLYADGILVGGQTLGQIISDSGTAEINIYTASLKDALENDTKEFAVQENNVFMLGSISLAILLVGTYVVLRN